jgi:hypothetical protein
VSDFIARVAARAVGERAAASPRVPALFGAAGPGLDSIEVIDEEVVVPAPDSTLAEAPAPQGPGEPPTRSAALPPLPVESAAELDSGDAPSELPAPEPPARPSPRHVSDPALERLAPPQPAAPPPTRHERRAPPDVAVASPRPTPALPIAASTPASAAPTPAAALAEPPAVRVHIGRLEVRANLQAEQQRAERAPTPRPQELSLSDYLRGRRERR